MEGGGKTDVIRKALMGSDVAKWIEHECGEVLVEPMQATSKTDTRQQLICVADCRQKQAQTSYLSERDDEVLPSDSKRVSVARGGERDREVARRHLEQLLSL
jgi:hypothetical protein